MPVVEVQTEDFDKDDGLELRVGVEFRPCLHNNWDNVRVKKNIVTLGCRDCLKKWKLPHPTENKCPDFYIGHCPFGPHCPYLHIHRFKSRLKSPNHVDYTVGTERDPLFCACASEVIRKHPPDTAPRAVYAEVIQLFAVRQFQENNPQIAAMPPTSQSPATPPPPGSTLPPTMPTNRNMMPAASNGPSHGAADFDPGLEIALPGADMMLGTHSSRSPVGTKYVPTQRLLSKGLTPPVSPDAPLRTPDALFRQGIGETQPLQGPPTPYQPGSMPSPLTRPMTGVVGGPPSVVFRNNQRPPSVWDRAAPPPSSQSPPQTPPLASV